jgi:hypothetical protein
VQDCPRARFFNALGAKTCPLAASIPDVGRPPTSDRAISIAGINVSKSLRRHFHRARREPDLCCGRRVLDDTKVLALVLRP